MNGNADIMYNPDQAVELRRLVIDNKKNEQFIQPKLHTIAVLSGKGGVGKSNLSCALAFALADFGKKVVLVDADLGLANLDIICGVRNARFNIAHLIDGSRTLSEILVHFRTSERASKLNGSVSLLPGGYGLKEIADLDDFAMERLFLELSSLEDLSDYLIMDAGAGIHKGALAFAYASELTLLVTTPEPTSIRDAYGVIKSLGSIPDAKLMLIVNMASSSREALDVAERIRLASMQFLGNAPTYLGFVLKDDIVERSVKNCRIFYRDEPDASASICVRNLAGELLRVLDGENFNLQSVNSHSLKGIKSIFRAIISRIKKGEKNE
ncbi:MAG: P-loop NTPase [Synergistaceae bacterium]|nr:P-loop NTPase [Synergistaceae bacterium]